MIFFSKPDRSVASEPGSFHVFSTNDGLNQIIIDVIHPDGKNTSPEYIGPMRYAQGLAKAVGILVRLGNRDEVKKYVAEFNDAYLTDGVFKVVQEQLPEDIRKAMMTVYASGVDKTNPNLKPLIDRLGKLLIPNGE